MALIQFKEERLSEWPDCWFGEGKRYGYVAILQYLNEKPIHRFYGSNDIDSLIRDTEGKETRYISLNAFRFGKRRSTDLQQIRNVGIDLDQYNLGLTIEQALDELQVLILDCVIPEPNLVLTSRGIQLFYTIQGGAAANMFWLSSYITEQYIAKLQHIGADPKAKDAARVMRVPGSINVRNNAKVEAEIWNDKPYTLQELQAYCKPLEKFGHKGKKKASVSRLLPAVHDKLSLFYRTNHVRLLDLERLVELRSGDMTGKRNIFLYIYAYHQSLICNSFVDLEIFINRVFNQIHSKTDKPMTKGELQRTIKSAYKDAKVFFEHYKANGYQVIYKQRDGIKKPYKTSNLINILDITDDEQRAMKCLHVGVISKEKDAERKRQEREAVGMQSMEKYNEDRKQQTEGKLSELQQILKDNPKLSNVKIAELMGVSEGYIRKLKTRTHVSL